MHSHLVKPSCIAGTSARRIADLWEQRMTKKQTRQAAILDLVAHNVVGSQEELRQLLAGVGMDVTQATLSRDLRHLRLARVPTDDGGWYVLPESLAGDDDKP